MLRIVTQLCPRLISLDLSLNPANVGSSVAALSAALKKLPLRNLSIQAYSDEARTLMTQPWDALGINGNVYFPQQMVQ